MAYYGEIPCQSNKRNKQPCNNHAYYTYEQQYLCGVHSKKYANRQKLPINPHKKELLADQLELHNKEIETQACKNKQLGLKGSIICYHMNMMKPVDKHPGFLNIFPNSKHGGRTDGLGMPSLSPMIMGPIEHNQPGLPPALNLENLHQSHKVFPLEIGPDGNPIQQFYNTRLIMYQDPVPHRHKESSGHKNVPVYSVWVKKNGQEVHLTYIESRQIYCHYYEQFALKSPDFHKLRQLIDDGYNLQICGYDAYQPNMSLDEHYLDPSRPFGHEMVLYTLLTSDQSQYPWRLHQTIDFS